MYSGSHWGPQYLACIGTILRKRKPPFTAFYLMDLLVLQRILKDSTTDQTDGGNVYSLGMTKREIEGLIAI